MKKKKTDRNCSWCQDEDSDIEITIEDGDNALRLFVGASCFYQALTHSLGNPKKVVVDTTTKRPQIIN